jgi:hypothetical protein
MKTSKLKIFTLASVIIFSSIFLSACGKKKPQTNTNNPTVVNNTVKTIEFKPEEKPYVSLIPRKDGHELKLKVENIPSSVAQIDYELLYSATDNGLEMEKGVGDTVKNITSTFERDLLLGTESCTNGCKYKYDEGITGGTLTLTFTTKDNQAATYETPFILKSSADLKKDKTMTLVTENFTINATTTTSADFFVLIKNYGIPQGSKANAVYTVFSNGNGAGKVTSITPNAITKSNTGSLVGDYLSL